MNISNLNESLPESGTEQHNAACSRLGVLTIPQLLDIAKQRRTWLIEEYIPEQSVGILVGEWGIGKSPFAVQLAITLAVGGKKFLGRYAAAVEPVPTLYLDYENGAQGFGEIATNVTRFMGQAAVPGTFRVYSPNYSPPRPPDLGHYTDQNYLANIIKKCGFRFVIIDPLRAFDPLAEKGNTEAITLIKRLRDTGINILFVHHPNKPHEGDNLSLDADPHQWMERASGASALVKNVDFRIGLQQQIDGTLITRSFVRNRGWGPVEYLVRVLDEVTDEPIGYRLEGGIDKLLPGDKEAFNKLSPSFRTEDARRAFNLSPHPTDLRLKQLESLALIRRVARGQWEKIPPVRGE